MPNIGSLNQVVSKRFVKKAADAVEAAGQTPWDQNLPQPPGLTHRRLVSLFSTSTEAFYSVGLAVQ
jgi:hypothetical protein